MGHGETFTFQDCEEQLVPRSIRVPSHQTNVNLGWIEFYDDVDHKFGIPSWELTYIYIPYQDTFESMVFLFPRWDMLVFSRASQNSTELRTLGLF